MLPLYFHNLEEHEIRRFVDRASYRLDTREQILPTLMDCDVREQLALISAPALVIVGEQDWITGVSQPRELAAGLEASSLLTFAGSGHHPFIDENAEFLRQVHAWLTENVRNQRGGKAR